MRATFLIPAIAVSMIALAGCEIHDFGDFGGFQRYNEDFHFNYPMKSGARLMVESFNGSVEVSAWDQETIDISGTKYARSQDEARDMKIDISHSADSVSIRAIRPSMRRGNYGAQFVIKVPRGVVWDDLVTSNAGIRASDGAGPARLKTSNGRIEVRGLQGSLRAETSNNAIELQEVTGAMDLHTSNGHVRADSVRGELAASTSNSSIRATVEKSEGSIRLTSSNGSIDLTLPAGAQVPVRARTSNNGITLHLPGEVNARLSASTSNGNIHTDFEMRLRGEIAKHHVDATIGNGGPLLDLGTSNGTVRVLK